ncbi:MAG: FecR domain-containing protein [Leptospirales bacterium]|nr:FecR domain-containing protein [Leptospirales bacterium]
MSNNHEELARRLLDQPSSQWPKELAPLRVEMRSMPPALRAKLDAMNQSTSQGKPVTSISLVRRRSFRIAAASFGTAIAASVLVYFAFIRQGEVPPVNIVTAEGEVLRNGTAVKSGDKLREGETLKVGNEGLAVLSGEDKGDEDKLRVQGGSELALESLQTGVLEFRMKVGRLLALVPKKKERGSREFWISTPTTVASVRGTVFSVETDVASTKLSTYEGAVEFRRRWEALEDLSPILIAKSEVLSGTLKVFQKASANVESGMESNVSDADFKERLSKIEPLSGILSGPDFVRLRKKKKLTEAETEGALKALDQAFSTNEARSEILKRVDAAFGEAPAVVTMTPEEMKARRESFEALSPAERQAKYDELRKKPMDRETFKREATRLMGKAPQEVILKNGETLYGTIFGDNGRYRVYTATEMRIVSPEEVEEILFE